MSKMMKMVRKSREGDDDYGLREEKKTSTSRVNIKRKE